MTKPTVKPLALVYDTEGVHNLPFGRIYISGPMNSLPGNNYPAFERAKKFLEEAAYEVVSPTDCDPLLDTTTPEYEDYMRAAVKGMLRCQTLVLLPGWHRSPGARAEMILGVQLNMRMFLFLPEPGTLVSMERAPGRYSVTN